jgi:hypothetical protein
LKYRALSLACIFGMTTLLFAACGVNNGNNGITTRNANPANWVRNATDPGITGNAGRNGNRTNTTRMAGFGSTGWGTASGGGNSANSSGNSGRTSTSSVGALGVGDLNGHLRNLGVPSSDVLLLGNLMIVGVNQQNQNAGNTGNAAGTRRSAGQNGNPAGVSGTTAPNTSGTIGYNRSGIGQARSNAAGTTGGTGSSASSTQSSDYLLRAHFGRQFRVMKVSDRKALQAMERVRRNLFTASSIRSHSLQIVQDMHYIVSKATDVSSHSGMTGVSNP